MDPVAVGGAALGSSLCGLAKRHIGLADRKAAEWVRPLQPLVVLLAALLFPEALEAAGLAVAGTAAAQDAGTATVGVITARELLERRGRARRKKPRQL